MSITTPTKKYNPLETYVVYPRTLVKRGHKKISLQMLRKQISRSWHGQSAVQEIRSQRDR